MKSTFLVTIESEFEMNPLSIESVLQRGFPTSIDDVKVEAAQPSVQADGAYCNCEWNPLPAIDNGKCRACGKPRR